MTEIQKSLQIEGKVDDGTEQCKCAKKGCNNKFYRFRGDDKRTLCPEHQKEAYINEEGAKSI